MLNNYFKTIFRNLLRNKSYSAINIVGLSFGLACAMLIILYTKDELSYDRFHNDVSQIYRIVNNRVKPDGSFESRGGNTGTFQGPKFTASIPELKSYVRFNGDQKELKQGTEIVSKQIHVADSNFFSVFTFPLLQGNPVTALKEPNSVVISEKMAKEQFGTTEALGKTMFFKNGENFDPYVVTGVAKNSPQNSSIQFDILMPLKIDKGNENWGNIYLNTVVVLAPNADIKQTEAKMKKVYETDAAEDIKTWAEKFGEKNTMVYTLQPYTDIHLSKIYSDGNGLVNGSNVMYSYILSGIALFILLIACINFVNLTVARSIKRAKEIGIRKVVGGDRKQLMIQFLGESFALCFGAFLFAILLVQLILPTFNQLANKALYLSYLFDVKLVAGYIVLFLITGLLAGFYPALILSGYNPVQTLYNRFTLSGKSYLQKSLVVLQFSLATLLVVSTITIYSQFSYLTNVKLGYDDKNVVIVEKRRLTVDESRLFKEELVKSPDVISVASKNGGRMGTAAHVNGETEIGFDIEMIDDSYLPLYKIPVVKGRNFSAAFPSDSSNSVLVNETFVKQAGWKDPIGQIVDFWYNPGEKYTVVGVVKDYHFRPLSEEIGPQLFRNAKASRDKYGIELIKIKPNTAGSSLQYIEATFKKLFPINSYTYKFKDLENLKNYEAEAKWKQMMLFGAVITIFISCIGLFGLSVLSAEKRTKEIGIRKV
ncbi:MAG TPA: antibiotic ABC transporter permease, partial [Sphingobacteriaceae bacterium]|nr:antibiotic ABC transporter permease [Sphingobacteriaceae bacterium]